MMTAVNGREERQVSMDELSRVLWRERELVDLLAFKLEEEQLVLASGRERWVPHAAHEIEVVLDGIRQTELLRALTADAVSQSLGLAVNSTLLRQAEASSDPWRMILLDHHDALTTAAAERSLPKSLLEFLR
jgi:hypothetical protein